jgi:hypothetical protein
MRPVEKSLTEFKASLCDSIDIGGLFSRNKIAHKWKATFRSLELRETIACRTQDLLEQSLLLFDHGHLLGARILLRSAFESIAVLIYLNQLTRNVLEKKLGFHVFSEKTATLLLGSRDGSTHHKSLNIITILEKSNKRYPGILELYGALSESAHPNYEGTCIGYAEIDRKEFVANFSNKWKSMYSERHINHIELCIETFFIEYNEEWPDAFENLETWIEENDAELEAAKEGA